MLFKSSYPDIEIPTTISAWDYLFTAQHKTIGRLANEPEAFVDVDTKERLTHAKIKDLSIYLSTALLQTYGLKEGEIVSLCAPNSVWYPVAMFGVMRAGLIGAASSPGYTEDEMVHAFKTVGCKLIICSLSALSTVRKAVRKLGINGDRVIVLDGEIEGFSSVKRLIEDGKGRSKENQVRSFQMPKGKTNNDVCALLCFSSGTTGLPKAVMISHQNIIAQCFQLVPTTSEDHKTILGLLPFYHITGVVKLLALPFVISASVVILSTFTMPALLSTISHYRIAEVQLVPPLIIRLAHDPTVSNYDLSCIKRFASGAAPISPEVLSLLEKKFPGRGFKQGYGMTESTGCITTHPLDKHAFEFARTGGTLVGNTVVKIVDGEGREVGVDEKGEILAKGPQMVMGYYNNPSATASSFTHDKFLKTGDEGSICSSGLITISDRIKEMIKVKGIQVAPAELEDCLLGHPNVEDCAVISVPDDYSGERPFGFVVLKDRGGKAAGEGSEREMMKVREELLEYVKGKKVRTKWLVGIEFLEVIPKSASGKILRRVLRDRVKNKMSSSRAKL